ncbi:DUF6100 family protein [Butyrivibrio sp. AC2005]|uniref:DUF6100 family protein n=1 Tax=Butyrivibrio sp. AC2005 TaxID=1280672 RepID=UPI000424DA4D|nr:DUF6100 family protein [Butyrivibrio sp. AC2005]
MAFTKLSDEEIEEYVKNSIFEETEGSDNRRAVSKMFKILDVHIASLKESADSLKEMMFEDSPSTYFVNNELVRLNSIIKKIVSKTAEIGRYSGFTGKHEINNIVGEELQIDMDGERLHVVFPSLLPKRIERQNNKAVYTNADIRQMYEPAFSKFFSGRKHTIYSKKAVIIYTHFFSSEKEFRDHDNFETKIITDLITANILLDDSPRHCAIFMDYKMGEYSHTEVDVIPFEELRDFLK